MFRYFSVNNFLSVAMSGVRSCAWVYVHMVWSVMWLRIFPDWMVPVRGPFNINLMRKIAKMGQFLIGLIYETLFKWSSIQKSDKRHVQQHAYVKMTVHVSITDVLIIVMIISSLIATSLLTCFVQHTN